MPLRLERVGHRITSVETWFEFAPPRGRDLHWRDGRSAKESAKAWCMNGQEPAPPRELVDLLETVQQFENIEFDVGYPEHRVSFDMIRGEPRNTDLAVKCLGQLGPVGLSIEAKADESFSRTVGEEIASAAMQWAADERTGKIDRIRQLTEAVLPRHRPGQAPLAEIRYQLLTAIAGTWAFAAQVGASTAVLVIHEFIGATAIPGRIEQNERDLDRVVRRITRDAVHHVAMGTMIGPLPVPASEDWQGVTEWYLGKCRRAV